MLFEWMDRSKSTNELAKTINWKSIFK